MDAGTDVTGGALEDGAAALDGARVGIGRTTVSGVGSTAATGVGSIAERMPNQDRPTATAVTTAQAARYPSDRLTAATLP